MVIQMTARESRTLPAIERRAGMMRFREPRGALRRTRSIVRSRRAAFLCCVATAYMLSTGEAVATEVQPSAKLFQAIAARRMKLASLIDWRVGYLELTYETDAY